MTTPLAPAFATPSSSGQLSNKRGANTGADALPLKVTYKNSRGVSDPVGLIRFSATKVPIGGGSSSSALDTWWLGAGTQNALLKSLSFPFGQCSFTYNGRVYLVARDTVANLTYFLSAPIEGPSVGQWRFEPPPASEASSSDVYGMPNNVSGFCQVGAFVYIIQSTQGIGYYASISSDGVIGSWTVTTVGSGGTGEKWLIGWSASGGASWVITGRTAANTITWQKVNANGSLASASTTAAGPANKGRCGLYFAPNNPADGGGTLYIIGGFDNVNPSLTIHKSAATVANGVLTMGTPAAAGTGLPAAVQKFGFAVANGFAYVIGGDNAGAQTAIYRIAVGSIGTSAWTTDAQTITATSDLNAVGQAVPGGSTNGGQGTGGPTWFYFGGASSSIFIASLNASTGALLGAPAGQSVGAELTNAQLGTGGVVTNNPDGSVTITYLWQGNVSGGAALVDGDVVTLTVQYTDQQGGDLSSSVLTTFKVGQPPTVSNVSPSGATTNCQPTVSFNYVPGVGGGPEVKYQIQIKDNGGNVVADTGITAGQANTSSPKLFPMLASGLAASVVITVYSTDTPMPGSTNSNGGATTAFTPTQTAPSNPGTASVTADSVGGSVIPSWKDPSGGVAPTFNRLYWRLSGASIWIASKDLIVATQNVQQNFTLMDNIPLGQAVEIGVSSLAGASPGTTESAIVSCGTITINPDYHQDLGGYTAMLHVVGNGPSQRVPIPNLPPIKYDRIIDSEVTMMFGNTAPSIRYGIYIYREISIDVIPLDSQIATLDSVLAAAQTGSVLCYRDTVGTIVYCGLPPSRSRQKDLYYKDALKLIETQFTFTP